MFFPNERSYHAFQLTGRPWATLALVILAMLAVFWSSSSKGDTDAQEPIIEHASEMTHKHTLQQSSMDAGSEQVITELRSD